MLKPHFVFGRRSEYKNQQTAWRAGSFADLRPDKCLRNLTTADAENPLATQDGYARDLMGES
jgi:hypothetical protein